MHHTTDAPTETHVVSDEDWAFFIEATYVDPAEREW